MKTENQFKEKSYSHFNLEMDGFLDFGVKIENWGTITISALIGVSKSVFKDYDVSIDLDQSRLSFEPRASAERNKLYASDETKIRTALGGLGVVVSSSRYTVPNK